MAPSPEHDNEPKAPDKNENKKNTSANKLGTDLLDLDSTTDLQVSAILYIIYAFTDNPNFFMSFLIRGT